MNPTIRSIIVISIKSAIGAVISNSVLMTTMGQTFNTHNRQGLINLGLATLSIIGGSEAKVWLPRIMAWLNTPTPLVINGKTDAVQVPIVTK